MAGILYVSSKILEPTKLSTSHFDAWYETEHALEVLRLPGIPSATRYSPLSPNAPYLITYEFPDLSYAQHPDFQAVASLPPDQQLVDRIYAHAGFDIRFYADFALPALSPASSSPVPGTDAPLLACVELSPRPGSEGEAQVWFAGKFALEVKQLPGFVRARRFEFGSGVRRERNVVGGTEARRWLALVEFDGEVEGVREGKGLEEVLEEGLVQVDVRWYRVKKVWKEGDVQKIGQAP